MLSRVKYYLSSIPTLLSGVRNWPAVLPILRPGAEGILQLHDGTQFSIRTPMDIWIIKETCLDKDYERMGVVIRDGWIIIDIGAGLGDFTVSVARSHPASTVYAYEPFANSFELLQNNVRRNKLTNVTAFPIAIGGKDGMLTLDVTSSGEAVQHSTATGQRGVTVKSVALNTVIASLPQRRCNFLKMDCEGAEFDILFNASAQTLTKIDCVCMEYHDGVTAHTHTDLRGYLESNGFSVTARPNPVHSNLGFLCAQRR